MHMTPCDGKDGVSMVDKVGNDVMFTIKLRATTFAFKAKILLIGR